MIRNKGDLNYYLEADAIAIGAGRRPHFISIYESDVIHKFQIILRKTEYYYNCRRTSPIGLIITKLYQYRLFRMQVKTGFNIPINVFGPGFSISHIGPIVVNGQANVGKNCRIHPFTTIGMNGRNYGNPGTIGDNVYLSAGCKVIGDISIADDVCIGAGAVVTKTIKEPHTTWGGVPAIKISNNGSGFPMERRGADIAKRNK